MRTLWPWLMATALVAACEQTEGPVGPATNDLSFQSTAVHVTETHSIQTTITNPCNGEDIALTGVARNTIVTVSSLDNTNHITVAGIIHGTGTGLTTGATYQFHDAFHFSFQTPSLIAPQGITFTHDQASFVSHGSGGNLFLDFDIHVVVTATGEVKTTVENFRGACRG